MLNSTGGEVGTYVKDLNDRRVFEVSDGILKIKVKRQDGKFYAGALTADNARTPTFGQGCYEIRTKLPNAGKGTWPAFWLISNTGGPSSTQRPEIDVMEHSRYYERSNVLACELSNGWRLGRLSGGQLVGDG